MKESAYILIIFLILLGLGSRYTTLKVGSWLAPGRQDDAFLEYIKTADYDKEKEEGDVVHMRLIKSASLVHAGVEFEELEDVRWTPYGLWIEYYFDYSLDY